MFKQQKPTNANQQPARQRLPLVERPPKQDDVSSLFTGALRIKGTLFELPIRPTPFAKTYLVTCEHDTTSKQTIWAMYEGEDGNTNLWNGPQTDLDIVLDMICMSCQQQGTSPTQLPPELTHTGLPAVPKNQDSAAWTTQSPANSYTGMPAVPNSQDPGAWAAQSAANTLTSMPAVPNPQDSTDWGNQPPVTYPNNQSAAWESSSPNAYTGAMNTPGEPILNSGAEMTNFIDLLNKGQPNLLLGHLFVEAGMVPERCLDSALKLQEMVRKGRLTNEEAIAALKRTAANNCDLTDDVIEWAKNPNSSLAAPPAQDKSPPAQPAREPSSTPKSEPNKPDLPKDNPGMSKIIELLKQAGLITEADIDVAKKVKAKHGGDIGQILVSAGKISGKTLEATANCQDYLQHKCLRIDQAIMALHYCERMRSTLKEALEELGIEIR